MKKITFIVLMFSILSACAPRGTDPPTQPETPTVVATPPTTPTAVTRSLNICLGEEPNTLYPYGNLNAAARSVLSAIYDGPFDVVEYAYEPIILEKIPSLEDGDAQVGPVTVRAGDRIVDAGGNVVLLAAGTRLRPLGCRNESCEITYDGSSDIQMDQIVVTFKMLEGLMWSDGTPLTANDSVYSFDVAASDNTPSSKYVIDRTQTYEAADDFTTQWWGMPGFIYPEYFTNFWIPLPQHLWGESTPQDLTRLDASSRRPVGWGPYILTEWRDGESLHLIKNLNYFRASSNLPHFDELNFLIMPDANAALTALVDGKCDVLDPSVRLDGQVGLLQQMEADDQAELLTAQTMTMEWLGIGIVPASYDNGYNPAVQGDRPDVFGDERMRQALAYCLDRQKVVDTVLFGLSQVPDSYLPTDHALHNGNLETYPFNPEAGNEILERVGWIDHDNDPTTPRQAIGATNVPGGTPLILNYQTSSATQRRQVAEILTGSLAQCGVGLNPLFSSASDLYAQGPQGPLFGRQFDLAAYAIGVNSLEPQCSWFTSSEIPSASNNWIGTNISGYENPDYDAACGQALESLPGEPEYAAHQEAQAIFASELPSIPLYLRLKVAAARPEFCGFSLDPSSNYTLADIETFDYGTGCRP
jgi:peptide/nickel transport system substrate-binding protein